MAFTCALFALTILICDAKTVSNKSKKSIQNHLAILNFIKNSDRKEISKVLPDISIDDVKNNSDLQITAKKLLKYKKAKNITKTTLSWIIILCVMLTGLKLLFSNFNIPFNYDPNFKCKNHKHKYTKFRDKVDFNDKK